MKEKINPENACKTTLSGGGGLANNSKDFRLYLKKCINFLRKQTYHSDLTRHCERPTEARQSGQEHGSPKLDCHSSLCELRNDKRAAFTLSEVLITVVILGLIASIIIPNIIHHYQKRLTVTKLQKAYTELETMANNLAVATGCVGQDISCTGFLSNDYKMPEYGGKDSNKVFVPKIAKLMGFKDDSINGIISRTEYYANLADENDKENKKKNAGVVNKLIKGNDNIYYTFLITSTFCSKCCASGETDKYAISVIVYIPKKKNITSKDVLINGREIFFFSIHDNFIVSPAIISWNGRGCPAFKRASETIDSQCAAPVQGETTSCAAKIIKDGWKMNY